MSLKQRIDDDIKAAMKAREKDKLSALRAVKSALLLELTKGGAAEELSDAEGIKILQKLHKQRKDAAAIYNEQDRADLAAVETFEADIIGAYLPEQMSQEELEKIIGEIVSDLGASSMADMGKVMGAANKQLAGKADGGSIASVVKKLLAG